MHDHSQFREALEACRPGRDDLSLPELASVARRVAEDPAARDLYERTQQSDALVGEAFQDIPLPAGLEDRLLAALALASPEPRFAETKAAVLSAATDTAADAVGPQLPAAAPRFGRWAIGAVATAAALVVGVAAFQLLSPAVPLGPQQIVELASESHDEAELLDANWNGDLASAPAARPFSRSVQVRPIAWQLSAGLSDSHAVAYQLSDKATLHVFQPREDVVGLPAAPPLSPQQSSGRSVGAWKSGDLVYALVVEGPRAAYQALVKPSAGLAKLVRPQSFASRNNS